MDLGLDIGIKSVAFFSNCESNRYNKHFNIEHLYKLAKVLDKSYVIFLTKLYKFRCNIPKS